MATASTFRRTMIVLSAALPASMATACHAGDNAVHAAPGTLQNVLMHAEGGERIVLAPGDYGAVIWAKRTFQPAVTIDASQARFTAITMRGIDGLILSGGSLDGPRAQTFGVFIGGSRHITVQAMHLTRVRVGIGVSESQDIVIARNAFDGIRSDGINLAAVQRVKVLYNDCRGFTPVPGVFTADGRHLKEGDHPDCVQAWPIIGKPLPSDIAIIGNTARGMMQGIFLGDGQKGGYDRVTIRGNTLVTGYYHAINVDHGRDVIVTGNTVRTLPGARMETYPFHPITAWVRAIEGQNVLICGNTIEQPRFSQDTGPCPASLKLPPMPPPGG